MQDNPLLASLVLVIIGIYFFVLPVALRRTRWLKKYFEKMGPPRYYVGMALLLVMMLMPIKMYLRWVFNLKYFVHIQEFFFNI